MNGTMKGESLPNDAGYRCADCGITVFANPNDRERPQIRNRLCTGCFERDPRIKLTASQVRALAAVRDGLVTHKFTRSGNTFAGPKGTGPALYRRLQVARLIEDIPGQRVTSAERSSHKQQLTKAGHAALAAAVGRAAP